MSLGTEHLGKDKTLLNKGKGLADGVEFKVNPYDLLDDLFYDEETEMIVHTKSKYISMAAKFFLEEMNFLFYDSDIDSPIIAINLEEGTFKFIEHMEDKIELQIPIEWDIFETDIKNYVSENPIVRKKVEKNPDGWNTPDGEEEKSLLEKSMESVKTHVKTLQDQYNLTIEEVAETLDKFKHTAVHSHNKTTYTAKGNAELQLESGVYNNLVDLVKKHGWEMDFQVKYGSSILKYMRSNFKEEGIEKRLLSEFGFEYCIDNITIDDNEHWNNRVIEVKYQDQKEEDFDIDLNIEEFQEVENQNNLTLKLNLESGAKEVRIRKKEYSNILEFIKYNKLYNIIAEELRETSIEDYLNNSTDGNISITILNTIFPKTFTDWSCEEGLVSNGEISSEKNINNWTTSVIKIGIDEKE